MTAKQTQLLNAISRAGEHGLSRVGAIRALRTNRPGASRVLNELDRKGLIRRSRDGRDLFYLS